MGKIVIIGGGASGLFTACNIKNGQDVIVVEKNDRPGRKLTITGKGRCNITNATDISNFIKNIPGNGKFLFSAFNAYTNEDVIDFFESRGLKTKVERGERVFPVSDSAKDVVNVLYKTALKNGVSFRFNTVVKDILTENGEISGVKLSNNEVIKCSRVVLATGGKSYPATGSTGDGYFIARNQGHTIVEPKPSLVGLVSSEEWIKELQGLSLKNVGFSLEDKNGKKVYDSFGEMLFTHFGVSGPIVLSGSRMLHKYMNGDLSVEGIKASIDLKPALSLEKLDLRVQRDFAKYTNKQIKNALFDLLPEKLIPIVIKLSGIDENKVINIITKEERQKLVSALKNLELNISALRPIDEAIVTSGGIKISEINPTTMESKIVEGLYFCGEVIDVDGFTGGFNLQIAFSTAYVVANSLNF